jgi:hypothetical protein
VDVSGKQRALSFDNVEKGPQWRLNFETVYQYFMVKELGGSGARPSHNRWNSEIL